jgi:hypothetical protein
VEVRRRQNRIKQESQIHSSKIGMTREIEGEGKEGVRKGKKTVIKGVNMIKIHHVHV